MPRQSEQESMTHFAWLRWHGLFGAYCGRGREVSWNWNVVDCPACHTLRAHEEALDATTA